MIESIISRGLDAPAKFAPTLKVRKGNARYQRCNDGRVRVRIIHGLNISQKRTHILIAKIYKSSKTKHYAHAPRGIDW